VVTARGLAVLLLLCAPAAWVAATAPDGSTAASASGDESVTVRRVHWPVLVERSPRWLGDPVDCAHPSTDWIEVREDGEPRPVTAIGPRPQSRVHALLIDTSPSMRPKLGEAADAADRYLSSLPSEDEVLLATFADNLVLRVPPTRDRAALREGLEGLSLGSGTALWDALYYLVRYLEPLGGEKVVLLITDGEDATSLEHRPLEQVLDLARATPDLTIFPVGLGLRSSAPSGFSLARHQLAEVARQTGGEFYEAKNAARLSGVFEKVRSRMAERLYVSYVPSHGDPNPRRIHPTGGSHWRKVSLRARPDSPCRVVPLGAPRRLEHRRGDIGLEAAPLLREDAIARPTAFEPCAEAIELEAISAKLRRSRASPLLGEVEQASYLCPFRTRRGFLGWTLDIAVERGPLFTHRSTRGGSRLRTSPDREPVFLERGFKVVTPPLARMRSELSGPADVLIYLIRHESCAPGTSEEHPYARSPLFVHGQTFFELRELLGRALYTTQDDYHTWAVERAERDVDTKLPRMLQTIPEGDALSPDRKTALRDSIVARECDPARGAAHNRLVAWLGDVVARDAALELERRVMNGLLDGRSGAAEDDSAALAESWRKLGRWFPPATQVRIVTPLVPAYDAGRDLIGFYRFLLPAPTPTGEGSETVPARPLGLLALRWLLEGEEAASVLLGGGVRVSSLEYASAKPRELRRAGCAPDTRAAAEAIERVAIEFHERSADAVAFRLVAFFSPPAESPGTPGAGLRPICLAVDRIARGSPGRTGRDLAAVLAAGRSRQHGP
jgi:VWFA-related protein